MSTKQHWEKVYASKPSTALSWYAPHLARSVQLMSLGDRADVLDGEPATCRACAGGELLQIRPIDDRRHAGSDAGQQPARTILGR